MAELVVPLLIAGTAASVAGTIQQGRAARAQARSEQDILNFNAEQKLKEAEQQRQYAQEEADKFSERGRRLRSTQKVSYPKGGVLMTGTPAYVLEETAQNIEADKMEILKQGFLQAGRTSFEATNLRLQGKSAYARGKNAYRGSLLTATGRGLSGAATAAYYKYEMEA